MTFSGDLQRFRSKVEKRARDIFTGCAEEVQKSITEGSALTGAPGQPVKTATLKNDYQPEYTSQWTWRTTTNLVYARPIEDGVGPHGPLTLRSNIGGFHSVKMTRSGWPRIVDHVTRQVARD